jgi:hypothetical protein
MSWCPIKTKPAETPKQPKRAISCESNTAPFLDPMAFALRIVIEEFFIRLIPIPIKAVGKEAKEQAIRLPLMAKKLALIRPKSIPTLRDTFIKCSDPLKGFEEELPALLEKELFTFI